VGLQSRERREFLVSGLHYGAIMSKVFGAAGSWIARNPR
jgi:hypothetical protein